MFFQFVFAFAATMGFCLVFNVPRRHMIPAAAVGALGWLVFMYAKETGISSVYACFIGSAAVAVASDLCSRFLKDAATLFIIPGILPLVPGAGMYNTMLAFLEGDLSAASKVGWETLLMAGSIAVALLVMASLIRIVVIGKRSLIAFFASVKAKIES